MPHKIWAPYYTSYLYYFISDFSLDHSSHMIPHYFFQHQVHFNLNIFAFNFFCLICFVFLHDSHMTCPITCLDGTLQHSLSPFFVLYFTMACSITLVFDHCLLLLQCQLYEDRTFSSVLFITISTALQTMLDK